MAADDFYAANPGYTTRLALHLGNSEGDAFRAAAAVASVACKAIDSEPSSCNHFSACLSIYHFGYFFLQKIEFSGIDLLKAFGAEAIIAPQQSAEARFVMKIGDKAHVPIISFSELSPHFSTKESPYYIQTSLADSTQARVISSIVQEFRWNQVVPVVEDSGYGNGILPYLIDSLQEINVHVPYGSKIPSSATEEQILKELIKLKKMQTRVFIAHLTSNSGLQFFSIAEKEGMLEEGYVWITTSALTDMALSATDVMQGVLGIKPYVYETKRLQNFKQRWRKKFQQEDPQTRLTEPTLMGLWAYDTVWMLALAAERGVMANSTFEVLEISNSYTDLGSIGVYSNGPKLLESIKRTNFDGLSGKFHLVESQLEIQTFEIVNLVGRDRRRIGFWRSKNGISGSKNSRSKLDVVTWPSGTKVVPKGWEWPTKGNKLRIAVPVQPKFNKFLYAEDDPLSKNLNVGGYSIDVFKAAMKELPYVAYELIPYGLDSSGKPNATYHDILYQVYLQNFDAVVGDVTIIANRSIYVDFTFPYTESGVSMLVPVKDELQKGALAFLKPFDAGLWLASGAFFLFTGFVVWSLEHRINKEFRGAPIDQFGNVLYFSFSSLVFAHREKLLSNLSRIIVAVCVFLVFILKSIYTASLSSMLTVEQLQPTVRDLSDLIKQGIHVGYMNYSYMPNLLKQWKFDQSKLIPFNSAEEYHEALSNGTLAVFLDETPYLKLFLNENCGKYTMVGPIYKTEGFGFAFPKGSLLVHEVSKAILKLLESDEMLNIEKKLYGSEVCDRNEYNGTSLISLTLHSFWGLFLMTGVTSITTLILYLASFLNKHSRSLFSVNSEKSLKSKLVKLTKIYDQVEMHKPIKVQEQQAARCGQESHFSDPNDAVRHTESDKQPETSFDGKENTSALFGAAAASQLFSCSYAAPGAAVGKLLQESWLSVCCSCVKTAIG
ncbi:glutamate receptor 2.7-like [Phalaenopsis equestris]|uniref:glutamate receptor 2.7-like n=1 Tax=Phalaenopsis equestris TaxID=78828 RepID=UPI0009E2EFD5|nr:glutamate receptor 2.7-like [Phalaenopsis equestris]